MARRHAEMEDAFARLLATSCTTQFGALCLLRHLRWHIQHDEITDAMVLGRAADLAAYLGLDFPPVEPQRQTVGSIVRAISRAGELIVGVVIIFGGVGIVGLASLL